MSVGERVEQAVELMTSFAERTGLTSEREQQRYLWTDAFAVCNFLALDHATAEGRYRELALRLIDRVHHTLGRHRLDDPRRGWISGLGETEGESHPTRGGLRIGKSLAERRTGEVFDEELEWERDGQYFHYLTKWMHALDQVSRATKEPRFNAWARELAETACRAFVQRAPSAGRARMAWKMSIDLSRPLVAAMGHHDPLDGFITCVQLHATASELAGAPEEPTLSVEMVRFASMIEGRDWATADPLSLGGLMMDACRVEQLLRRGALSHDHLLQNLLAGALEGLRHYAHRGDFRQPASRRLAFRELGLTIGLHAIELLHREVQGAGLLEGFVPYFELGAQIESFWLDRKHRQAHTWSSHRDINDVMLATSLVPEGSLVISSPRVE